MSKRTVRGLISIARGRGRQERGAVIVLLAVMGVGLIAIGSFVVDYGRVQNAQRELQAAADAAALSAAQDLPDGTQAENTAYAYGAGSGASKGNTRPDLPNVSTGYDLKCLTYLQNLGLTQCPNAIKVTQDASVPLLFLGGLGIPGISVHASALAAAKGGVTYPLDIMIVLDRTGSMRDPSPSGPAKIEQAKLGIQAFLSAMRPSSDRIGLALLPPSKATSCPFDETAQPRYENGRHLDPPGYVVVRLRNDFRTSDTGGLNSNSPLVKAVTTSSCPHVGDITSYTDSMDFAKQELNRDGRPDAQDVIIFFTDGWANYGPFLTANYSDYNNQQRTQPSRVPEAERPDTSHARSSLPA